MNKDTVGKIENLTDTIREVNDAVNAKNEKIFMALAMLTGGIVLFVSCLIWQLVSAPGGSTMPTIGWFAGMALIAFSCRKVLYAIRLNWITCANCGTRMQSYENLSYEVLSEKRSPHYIKTRKSTGTHLETTRQSNGTYVTKEVETFASDLMQSGDDVDADIKLFLTCETCGAKKEKVLKNVRIATSNYGTAITDAMIREGIIKCLPKLGTK